MKKNGMAYRRLFLSFMLILVIPTGMSLLFYLYSYRTVRERADASNRSLINTVKNVCDQQMAYYENALVQLALNRSVQSLAGVKGEFGAENSYELYTLYNELESMCVSINKNGNYCLDVFVYFKNSEKIVSSYGSMSYDMYCELYSGAEAEPKEKLKQELTEYHFRRATRMENSWYREGPVLLLTMANLQGGYGETSAMVGLWLDMGALNRSIESVSWEPGLTWMILNEDDQTLNSAQEYPEFGLKYEELTEENEQKLMWEGEPYLVRTVFSEVGNWKYVILMPESLISAQASQVRNVFLLSIIACMCVGFVAAVRMLKVNYQPIQKILDLFRTQDGTKQEYVENEFQYLEESAAGFFKEHSDFRQKVAENRRVLRQYYLAGLLENVYDSGKNSPDREAAVEGLRRGNNLVLLYHIEEADTGEQGEDGSLSNLRRFIIRNVFEEGIGEYFHVETVELGDTVAMIVNLENGPSDYALKLMETADTLQRFIRENFGFTPAVLAGTAHEGLEGIHESYREAREAEGFIDVLDAEFVSYEEIRNSSQRKYDYPQEQEGRIIGALLTHNAQLAVSYINKVLDVNLVENRLSSDLRQCLLFDLAGTLMKAAEQTGYPENNELGGGII